jgi:hypothetical protein
MSRRYQKLSSPAMMLNSISESRKSASRALKIVNVTRNNFQQRGNWISTYSRLGLFFPPMVVQCGNPRCRYPPRFQRPAGPYHIAEVKRLDTTLEAQAMMFTGRFLPAGWELGAGQKCAVLAFRVAALRLWRREDAGNRVAARLDGHHALASELPLEEETRLDTTLEA